MLLLSVTLTDCVDNIEVKEMTAGFCRQSSRQTRSRLTERRKPVSSASQLTKTNAFVHSSAAPKSGFKLEFHDADTDTDILADIVARMSACRSACHSNNFSCGVPDVSARILARKSVSVSWNASFTNTARRLLFRRLRFCLTRQRLA